MSSVHLSLSSPTILVILASGLAITISLFAYRYTVPPVARSVRFILAGLRMLGLFLLFFLIGEPLLSLIRRNIEPPVVAVLIDNSRSMTIKDRNGDRQKILTEVLQSSSLKRLSDIGDAHYGLFNGTLHFLDSFSLDSLTLSGDATDIATALKKVKEAAGTTNIQSILLISDGNVTAGASPLYEAEEVGLPIFTVGIGDTSEQKDVLIRKIITNAITYVGNRVPVHVTVKSSGYAGEHVEVTLRDGGTTLDRKMITLQEGTREYQIPLAFVPDKEGVHKYTVEVSSLPGELTSQNNRMSFFTKVLKSKMRLLLIAGAPNPDVTFVRRALESDKNIEAKIFIERGQGQFYEGSLSSKVLDESDCLFLIGFPGATSSSSALTAIVDAANTGKGIFFMMSRTVDLGKLQILEPVLPVSFQASPERGAADEFQAFLTIPDAEQNNPIIKLPNTSTEIWSKLAPIFKLQIPVRPKPEADVIGQTRLHPALSGTSADPFFVSRNVNRKKSLALLGYGIWRWKMLSADVPGADVVLEGFLSNAVRWLTTREEDRQVRVQPVKETFAGREPIEFTAQVYDEKFTPIDDAQITITMMHKGQKYDLTLTPLGSGQYTGSLELLPEGDYKFTATVSLNGKKLAEESGSFSVGGLNAEFLETRMNKPLLQQLAAQTGGKYYDANSLETLPKDIAALTNFKPREIVRAHEIELWNYTWSLTIVVALFAFEWFLRKRNGML